MLIFAVNIYIIYLYFFEIEAVGLLRKDVSMSVMYFICSLTSCILDVFHSYASRFTSAVLLCRGKAVSDFSGPDCRFLSVKKSETIYVYYKLSGRGADLWAGSVSIVWLIFNQQVCPCNCKPPHILSYLLLGWE